VVADRIMIGMGELVDSATLVRAAKSCLETCCTGRVGSKGGG
jgi:hypothetical protein